MIAVKRSTSYGKKGVINAPKKAFKAVVKMAAKLNKAGKKGTKAPKTGIQKVIHLAMKGIWR
jgi:hypothetical protein